MNKMLKHPESWIAYAICIGAVGFALFVVGDVIGLAWLYWIGLVLVAPGVLAIGLLMFVLIPFLIIINLKDRNKK